MSPVKSLLTAAAVFGLAQPASGNAFLKKQEAAATQFMNQTAIEMRFLKEVRGFVGKGPLDDMLPGIRSDLEPMWKSLPKNSLGRLDNAQVRYALHRLFVQRHGWHIDGLDSRSSSNTEIVAEGVSRQQVPAFLLELFDEAFGNDGLMLHELALFAATLEHMIHDEASDRLKDVYKVLSYSSETNISQEEVDEAGKAYLMSLMLGQDKLATTESLQQSFAKLQRTYPGWKHTQSWLQDVRKSVMDASSYSFGQVENYVQQVSHKLGGFQDVECKQLKGHLLEAEDGSTGRVKLSDFYKKGLATAMQFVEKPEYLRQLGALDESLPGEPRVIVSNYILSQGNCLADMGFYSICCINECEDLMGQLEHEVASDKASTEALAKFVEKHLSTSTVEAGRSLTPTMMRRLEDVAKRNGGMVPLHSRLFAQWMHFAFPRECPYPHTAGTTNPLTASEWVEVNEVKPNLQVKEMREYIENVRNNQDSQGFSSQYSGSAEDAEEDLLTRWSEEEEILYLPPQAQSSKLGAYLRVGFSVAMIAGVGVAVVDQMKRTSSGTHALVKLGITEKAHQV